MFIITFSINFETCICKIYVKILKIVKYKLTRCKCLNINCKNRNLCCDSKYKKPLFKVKVFVLTFKCVYKLLLYTCTIHEYIKLRNI